MELKHRVTDIKELQTQLLQDYLSMEIEIMYPDDSWKTDYYNEVKEKKDGKYRVSYEGAWTALLKKGVADYSVGDMDITTISCALLFMNSLKLCKNGMINSILKTISKDRNFESHLNSNESTIELFQFLAATIHNLREMTLAIGKYSHVEDDMKEKFARKYLDRIDDLNKSIQKDYEKESKLEALINKMLNEKNILEQNVLFSEATSNILIENSKNDYKAELLYFYNRCAEAGIRAANIRLAEEYAHYHPYNPHVDLFLVEVDYYKSEQHLIKAGADYNTEERLLFANLYVNELSKDNKVDDGWKILKSLIDKKVVVLKYKTEEGYTFYYRGSTVNRSGDEVLEL